MIFHTVLKLACSNKYVKLYYQREIEYTSHNLIMFTPYTLQPDAVPFYILNIYYYMINESEIEKHHLVAKI